MDNHILEVMNLSTSFKTARGLIHPVENVSFSVKKGQTVGLVGESGCGKSLTALSLLNLIESPPGKIEKGKILFNGHDILSLGVEKLRKLRGHDMSMIFQEPMTSLNPVFTIGNQINEVFITHKNCDKKQATLKTLDVLKMVKIPAPEKRINEYPHQLSGGMRQRVMIGMALACQPKLLIADEPTTALDVTIQAQILKLMYELQIEFGMSILMITHDLGVVSEICDHVLVMYAGNIIEKSSTKKIFEQPKHPYTQGLLNAVPKLGKKQKILPTIQGSVPSLHDLPKGCKFHDRCPHVMDICKTKTPETKVFSPDEEVKCWLYNK